MHLPPKLIALAVLLALAVPASATARVVSLFTIHDRPGSAHVYRHPGAPRVTVNSADWWDYSPRFALPFTATVSYDTARRTVGLTCRGTETGIFRVESDRISARALVKCDPPCAVVAPLCQRARRVILGPGADSFPGRSAVPSHDRLLIDALVINRDDTSAATLGLL